MTLELGEGVCFRCRPWCATTEAQWRNRQRNINSAPGVQFNACPSCGGTSWATTRFMIRAEPNRVLHDLYEGTPRKWKIVIACAVVAAIVLPMLMGCAASRELRHPCQDTNTCEAKR